MKTGELATWLGVSPSSIKTWSREFSDYLSPAARGGDNRSRRYFDEQDARILALVAELRTKNTPLEDIHATLAAMQAKQWVDLPAMPGAPPGLVQQPVVTQSEAQNALIQQRQALTREIALLSDRVNVLQEELEEERAAHGETRQALANTRTELGLLQGKLEVLEPERAQLHALQQNFAETQQKLGELKGKLEVIERERELAEQRRAEDRQLQTRLLIALAVVALILLAALLLVALGGGV
ncbi:MAG: hypothetical protein Kow0077_29170 [Anaerolineae bacterium]